MTKAKKNERWSIMYKKSCAKNAERWKIITHTLRVFRLDIEKDIDILLWCCCVHDVLDILLFNVHADVQNKLIIIMLCMKLCITCGSRISITSSTIKFHFCCYCCSPLLPYVQSQRRSLLGEKRSITTTSS